MKINPVVDSKDKSFVKISQDLMRESKVLIIVIEKFTIDQSQGYKVEVLITMNLIFNIGIQIGESDHMYDNAIIFI